MGKHVPYGPAGQFYGSLGCCSLLPDSALVDVCEVCVDAGVEPSGPPEWEFVPYDDPPVVEARSLEAIASWEHFVRRSLGKIWRLKVKAEWEAEQARYLPCCRRIGGYKLLEPTHIFDGWEWVANPKAPSPEELAGPDIFRPHSHPAEVAKRAAAREMEMEGMDDGEAALEAMYERDAFLHFMSYARIFGEGGSDDEAGGSDDEAGDGAVGAASVAGLSEGLAMVWGCD